MAPIALQLRPPVGLYCKGTGVVHKEGEVHLPLGGARDLPTSSMSQAMHFAAVVSPDFPDCWEGGPLASSPFQKMGRKQVN